MMMWKSIRVGNVDLDNPVFLAPMAGWTDFPFRKIVKHFGTGLVATEMISSKALVMKNARTRQMLACAGKEYPLSVQLFGSDPLIMSEAAKIVQDMGAALIDINMGCPQKKILKSGAGAALMRDEALAGELMTTVCTAVNVPVTVKMRLGWDEGSKNAGELSKIAEDSGVSLITVHARTKSQMFLGKADWKALKVIKEMVSIPVIANGDIKGPDDAELCLAMSLADGVMIGRGALGRPWIFKKILDPGMKQMGIVEKNHIIKWHMEEIYNFYPSMVSIGIAKKHLSYYSKGLRGGAVFRNKINETDSWNRLMDEMERFFEKQFTV